MVIILFHCSKLSSKYITINPNLVRYNKTLDRFLCVFTLGNQNREPNGREGEMPLPDWKEKICNHQAYICPRDLGFLRSFGALKPLETIVHRDGR